jgi:hypothetical protein
MHYGVLRRSGRYPWGSGNTPYERSSGFLGAADDLKRQGLSEVDIAKGLGLDSTTQLRAVRAIAKNQVRAADSAQALRLKNKGMSNVAIGQQMHINESSVRSLLDPALADKRDILQTTANLLKDKVGEDGYLDIGSGTENNLSISQTKLATAVEVLKEEGYEVHNVQVTQLGTGNKTTIKVLAPPGTTYRDIVRNPSNIKSVAAYSDSDGRDYTPVKPPVGIDPDRVGVRFAEQGGTNADGVIYVRRGVSDVSLGTAKYAQVRIKVGDDNYLKGMAMYNDDMPEGVDLLFNTNKSESKGKIGAMKPIKDDPTNPFGAITRQKTYVDSDGKEKQSVMNIVNEEGDWKDWSRTLSSQMLSKQDPALAKKQLDIAYNSMKDEFSTIKGLTNPVVKNKLLSSFADGAESASVHLKAAALPSQATHVILPLEKIKENEVYAPNYPDGTRVALVRFPHGGTFEIPELTVNNKNSEAKSSIDRAVDAIGIHPKVASRLSGADFDGDTVLVIPNNDKKIRTSPPLKDLEDFDPQSAYPKYDGMKVISPRAKQQQMGDVSNLITDMTVKGAKPEELARAVKHSMVVIDSEKHELNYKQSYTDNGIASLKAKYQGVGETGRLKGASTIISKSGNATVKVPERRLQKASEGGSIDPVTGKKIYRETGATYTDKTGKTRQKLSDSKPLLETDDAFTLSSGTAMENIYAAHSNKLKALADSARKASLSTGSQKSSPTAKKTYASQVDSLNAKLNTALKNKPKERQAQLLANAIVSAKTQDNPGMESADLKKVKGQALTTARNRIGAQKEVIDITPDEWTAIQAGAVTANKLSSIIDNANLDQVKELATPKTKLEVTPAKLARAQSMLDSGYTQAEIARALGIPTSTLNEAILGEGAYSG